MTVNISCGDAYGLLDHTDQDPTTSDKWMSHVECMFPQMPSAVSESNQIPADFKVCPAYPNPLNPAITLSFELSKRGREKIQIFDIRGRIVESL